MSTPFSNMYSEDGTQKADETAAWIAIQKKTYMILLMEQFH